jgi:exoribonuclease R
LCVGEGRDCKVKKKNKNQPTYTPQPHTPTPRSCHPAPNERKLRELQSAAQALGLDLDISSAGALQRSLTALRAALAASGGPDAAVKSEVVTLLATKPMQLAQYFCTAARPREAWAHYALAVELYTHFTSPIRCDGGGGGACVLLSFGEGGFGRWV